MACGVVGFALPGVPKRRTQVSFDADDDDVDANVWLTLGTRCET